VKWLTTSIFPRIREQLPEVELLIVGSNPTDEIRSIKSDGVKVLGFVDNLDELLSRTRVFFAPLRFGAGVKGKIGQAMSHGVPVVTTTIGAEGMGLTDGVTGFVSDNAASFATAVARLYLDRDLWNTVSTQSRSYIRSIMSVDVASSNLEKILH
jgi:glycosyltransferase involved in cell wall biosynthesis